jgi:hypothetical protein
VRKVPPNILQEKRAVAEMVERAVGKTSDILLFDKAMVGKSYPFKQDVPGVWVSGPDTAGYYVIAASVVMLGLKNIPGAINDLRSMVWDELTACNLAERVRSIDVTVEDLLTAA